jgi:hypothetical protein
MYLNFRDLLDPLQGEPTQTQEPPSQTKCTANTLETCALLKGLYLFFTY